MLTVIDKKTMTELASSLLLWNNTMEIIKVEQNDRLAYALIFHNGTRMKAAKDVLVYLDKQIGMMEDVELEISQYVEQTHGRYATRHFCRTKLLRPTLRFTILTENNKVFWGKGRYRQVFKLKK